MRDPRTLPLQPSFFGHSSIAHPTAILLLRCGNCVPPFHPSPFAHHRILHSTVGMAAMLGRRRCLRRNIREWCERRVGTFWAEICHAARGWSLVGVPRSEGPVHGFHSSLFPRCAVSLFPVSFLPLVKFELDQSPVLLLPTLHSLDVYDMRNTSSCPLHSAIYCSWAR